MRAWHKGESREGLSSRAELGYNRWKGAYFSNLIYRTYNKAKSIAKKPTFPEEVPRKGDQISCSIESFSGAIGSTSNTGCHF